MLSQREIGHRIREVREESGIAPRELAIALGVSVETVKRLEDGYLDPLPGDYVLIAARVLQTDFRYFISTDFDEVLSETRKIYRALGAPSPADRLAIRRFVSFSLAEAELEELLEIERPKIPPTYPDASLLSARYIDQGVDAARRERARLGLGNKPIANMFELLRTQGARVFRHDLENSELSGLTVLHPLAGVCVLVNYFEDLYRQFFSAAHEYAHVLFDRKEIHDSGCMVSYQYAKQELVEMRANRFAAEFLLPEEALSRYARPRDLNQLKSFIDRAAREYRVNAITVAIRVRQAGWISDKTLESFKMTKPVVIPSADKLDPDIPAGITPVQYARRETAMREGISAYMLELLRRAVVKEQISFGRFSEMLGMSLDEARDFVSATGLAL